MAMVFLSRSADMRSSCAAHRSFPAGAYPGDKLAGFHLADGLAVRLCPSFLLRTSE